MDLETARTVKAGDLLSVCDNSVEYMSGFKGYIPKNRLYRTERGFRFDCYGFPFIDNHFIDRFKGVFVIDDEFVDKRAERQEEEVPKPTLLDEQVGGTHYSGKAIQPIEYIEKNGLGFCEGNVVKYITRHKEKNGAEDIKKVMQYCKFILAYQYGEEL